MDPQLPTQLVQFLAPFLPYLLKGAKLAGQEAARKPGEKAGEKGFEQAKTLWDKLRPKVEASPAALETTTDVATNPQGKEALGALRFHPARTPRPAKSQRSWLWRSRPRDEQTPRPIKQARGSLKGIDTRIERDEEDRV